MLVDLPQFARAIEYLTARLQQQGHEVRAVVAHSLAANALAYAAARGLPAARLALLAPPASPHAYTRLFAMAFGLSEDTRERLQKQVEAREGILMRQFEPAAVGPRVTLPTLIVVATQGLGHTRLLRDEKMVQAVASHVRG